MRAPGGRMRRRIRNDTRNLGGGGGGGGAPEWLPAGAVAFADFSAGHYYAGGAETTAADTISDPSKIVSSSGLVFANGDNSQTVIGDFADTLLGTTATVVVEYEFTIGSALNPVMVANDAGDSQETFYTYVVNRTDTFAAAGHYSDPVYPPEVISTVVLASGVCRVAFTFSPTKVSLSANSETPAVTDATTISAAATRVVIGKYSPDTPVSLSDDFVFRSITVYAPVADADLPALSAVA